VRAPPNPSGRQEVAPSKAVMDTPLDKIMSYEAGRMADEQVIEFFQGLVSSGAAWALPGHYGRVAQRLIECHDEVRRARAAENRHKCELKIFESIRSGYERKYAAISRELERRKQEGNRGGGYT